MDKEDEKVLLDRILKAIQEELQKSTIEFFSYAWREKVSNILTEESRFSRLIEWINNELEQNAITASLFNPAMRADHDDKSFYSKGFFENYKEALLNQSLLIHARETMLDEHCTDKHRETIEAMLCKMFNIKYNKERNIYF